MELFPDGTHVRLRSRVHGTYLHADEDGSGVSLRPRGGGGAVPSAAGVWRVHRVLRDGIQYVLLHGAAYGLYLALSTDEAAPPPKGCAGSRVVQRGFDHPELDAVMWRPVPVADGGGYVLLRHVYNGNLRANGRFRFWNNSGVSLDYYFGTRSTMRHWRVELVPPRPQGAPDLPHPSRKQGGRTGFLFLQHAKPEADRRRVIKHLRSDEPLNFGQDGVRFFSFYGRSVYNLRTQMGIRANQGDVFGTIMCVQAGLYGRLTPLVNDLPHSDELMNIVMFTAGAPDAEALVYPDVDAEEP
ncbi:uncharacterized protein LOC120705017 [Panicum virgatum]|uniref:DUF569 domain-containing protein n=1 Tax=Panicum virgatum TaxID=38727 RepID=A0A8T0THY7_PANVG|nr:uncharacterized protein LOC120705017 [Panicum virgatum]KAG2609847.1 hypothetical protein PVAP13_4KG071100 [Panicum virgatum]